VSHTYTEPGLESENTTSAASLSVRLCWRNEVDFGALCRAPTLVREPCGADNEQDKEHAQGGVDIRINWVGLSPGRHEKCVDQHEDNERDDYGSDRICLRADEPAEFHLAFDDCTLLRVVALWPVELRFLFEREEVPQPLAELDVEECADETCERQHETDRRQRIRVRHARDSLVESVEDEQ
jgi:hypothetical protein